MRSHALFKDETVDAARRASESTIACMNGVVDRGAGMISIMCVE
jgi:hypothetical protein